MHFTVENLDLGGSQVGYLEAWELQRAIHADVVAQTRDDVVLLLEHEPVYTAGRRTEAFERPMDGTPVIDVDRGGKITGVLFLEDILEELVGEVQDATQRD